MIMSGPLLTGYTQTINDYYDRELDAINEPYRPIPSGACPCPLWLPQHAAAGCFVSNHDLDVLSIVISVLRLVIVSWAAAHCLRHVVSTLSC